MSGSHTDLNKKMTQSLFPFQAFSPAKREASRDRNGYIGIESSN